MLYSVVIPFKNEEENIRELVHELEPVMNSLNAPWELIAIDDGSDDSTLALLERLSQEKPYLRFLSFDKNYGQSSAFDAGFKASRGAWIITLDGDRQNDPHDIPKLVAASSHADLVAGRRAKRKDPLSKKLTSLLANWVRSGLLGDGIKDTGCSLKLYRKSALQAIPLFTGMHRFLPALFQIWDFRVVEVPVNHRERMKGKSKYNLFNRSFNTLADLLAVSWMKRRKLNYRIKKSHE